TDPPAPRPGQARGVARPGDDGPSPWLVLPRTLLALPRLAFRTVTQPLVGVAELEDRYRVSYRVADLLFNDARTFGIFPIALIDPPLRSNVGARLIHRDLLGRREHLSMSGSYGGKHEQTYDAEVDSGVRIPGGLLVLKAAHELRDRNRFYGLGNAELVEATDVSGLVDARDPDVAVAARFRSNTARVKLSAHAPLGGRWAMQAHQQVRRRELTSGQVSGGGGPWVSEVFDPDTLRGADTTLHDLHTQLSLSWDSRQASRRDMPRVLPDSGQRVDAWAGAQAVMDSPRGVFGRFGLDLQQFVNLYRGDRVLRLRLRAVAVAGPLEEIPFTDMPALGGARLLRGYRTDRFRGRFTTLATAEYRYPIQERIAGYLFVDAGRAHADVDDLSLSDPRIGYGMGIATYTLKFALLRLQLATSIDGGFAFHLRLNVTDEPRISY
ncbi:MAG: BamA/TamA family outer membrane protein, partial [Myxococcales bacterium]|nr:BamA/TamA family outer membrane protein [Myxococcales bacterium]